MQIRIRPGWGDAVPGGYNGSLIAEHDGRPVGSLEYQSASGLPGFKIAMLKVLPEYQGRGIGSGLLMAARREMPDGPVDPGWMTDQGYLWWQNRGEAITQEYRSSAWSPEPFEFETVEPRAGRQIPAPEFEVEIEAG